MEKMIIWQSIMNRLRAIKDNTEDIMYLVDYTNSSEEDENGRANVVCVHYEDTYMVDNTVNSRNTRKIYIDEILQNPNKFTLYEFMPFKLNK